MAQSTNPILWDFTRMLPNSATDIGGLVEYSDTQSQSIYMESTDVATGISTISEGDWEHAQVDEYATLFQDQFTQTAWDMPCIEMLAGAGIHDGNIYYIRALGELVNA